VHHALAFSTLLSSQETDATTITTGHDGRLLRGIDLVLFSSREFQPIIGWSPPWDPIPVSGATVPDYLTVRSLSNQPGGLRSGHVTNRPDAAREPDPYGVSEVAGP
ncbi:hypothetical protein, partial [Microtetraspora sp. AC03309]|uniref:hypothetical protein n=1 Tax=Microtetraspora sp. AC03309 TaxID=2779376 RepID=UPI001E61601A